MKEGYSSKQKKIYEEYSLYSSDMLNAMVNDKKNHKSEIIRIINDILAERNRGFHTPELKMSETREPKLHESSPIPEEHPVEAGEFPEPEEGSQVVYEEVPWLSRNQVYFPGISGAEGNYINVTEEVIGDEPEEESVYKDEDEIDIEEEKKNYWKCPECNELVEMDYDVCWKCQAEMPKNVEHPDGEEVIKEIRGNYGRVKTAGIGFSLIITGGIVMLIDRDKEAIYDDFVRYIFGGFFVLTGLFLIVFNFIKKKN